jgi:hypothetical protein
MLLLAASQKLLAMTVVLVSLSNCSSAFVNDWTWHRAKVFPVTGLKQSCLLHGETGMYVCDAFGCHRQLKDDDE